jgi:hypothetical protein
MGRVLADTSSVSTRVRGVVRGELTLAEVNGGGILAWLLGLVAFLVSRGRAWASHHFGPGPRI